MKGLGKLFKSAKPTPPKHSTKFPGLDIRVKNKKQLQTALERNSKFQKVMKKVPVTKTVVGLTVVGGVTAFYTQKTMDHLEKNTGCFLRKANGDSCKIDALSCCKRGVLVDLCPNIPAALEATCDGYDQDQEHSCCRRCHCDDYGQCAPGDSLFCAMPTVNEALGHVFEKHGIGNLVSNAFQSLGGSFMRYLLIGLIVVVAIVVAFRLFLR